MMMLSNLAAIRPRNIVAKSHSLHLYSFSSLLHLPDRLPEREEIAHHPSLSLSSMAASSSAAASNTKATCFDLVRLGPTSTLHQIARFDSTEDPFTQGQSPFFCYQEKEEILPDEDEKPVDGAAANGKNKRPPRQPRTTVRWTLEDGPGARGIDGGLLYHGQALAIAPGSAYVLMLPNRSVQATKEDKKKIFVVPVGPWIGYNRVADAVDVPTSVKEAEAMMRGGKKGGGGGKKKEEDVEEEKLSRRQMLERFLTKSLGDDLGAGSKGGGKGAKGGGGGGKKKKGGGGGGKGKAVLNDEDDDEERGRGGPPLLGDGGREGDIGDDLAQNADTRELIGLGEDNEDDYEFQDDEEDRHDVNNMRVEEEVEADEEEEEEEEEDDEEEKGQNDVLGEGDEEEEEDDYAMMEGKGTLGGLGGKEQQKTMSVREMEKRFERPQVASSSSSGAAALVGEKRKAAEEPSKPATQQAAVEGKRAKLTFEPNSLESAVRERLVGLGGRVKGKDLSRAVKSLLKKQSDVQAVKEILSILANTETDPVDGGKIYTIRSEYNKG